MWVAFTRGVAVVVDESTEERERVVALVDCGPVAKDDVERAVKKVWLGDAATVAIAKRWATLAVRKGAAWALQHGAGSTSVDRVHAWADRAGARR